MMVRTGTRVRGASDGEPWSPSALAAARERPCRPRRVRSSLWNLTAALTVKSVIRKINDGRKQEETAEFLQLWWTDGDAAV